MVQPQGQFTCVFGNGHIVPWNKPISPTYPSSALLNRRFFQTSRNQWDMFLFRSLNTCILGFIFTTSTWDPLGSNPSLPCNAPQIRCFDGLRITGGTLGGCQLHPGAETDETEVVSLFFVRVAQRDTFFSIPRWWFQTCFIFIPKIGEDEPILTSIFFKGVGSTTN